MGGVYGLVVSALTEQISVFGMALSVEPVVEFADIAIGDVFEAALRFVVDNAGHADFSKIRDAMPR